MTLIDSVVSYPPEHHVLRDLAFDVQFGRSVNRGWMPVNEFVCNARGRVQSGLVATLVDAICGGLAAVTAAPGWIATADLSMHISRPIEGDVVEAVARVRRAGRTTVVLESEIFVDDREEPTGIATATFSVLQRRDTNPLMNLDLDDEQPRRSFVETTSAFQRPAYEACGFVRCTATTVEVPVHPYILNTLGGVQGGILASLIDAATVNALGDDFETADLHLTYLALAKQGPITAKAEIREVRDAAGTVAVEVSDRGASRVTTRAQTVGVRW